MTLFDELNNYGEKIRDKGYTVNIEHYEDGNYEIMSITVIIDKKRNRGKDFYG